MRATIRWRNSSTASFCPPWKFRLRAERVKAEIEARRIGAILGARPIRRCADSARPRCGAGAVPRRGVRRMGQALWRECAAPPCPPPGRRTDLRDGRHGDIEAKLGSYAFSADTPILRGTWTAAREAVNVVLSAAAGDPRRRQERLRADAPAGPSRRVRRVRRLLLSQQHRHRRAVVGRCRPAPRRSSTSIIITATARNRSSTRAATCCSARCMPIRISPIRISWASPTSAAKARAKAPTSTCRCPPTRIGRVYEPALARGLAAVEAFGPDVLLVSLGLDTYIDDPIASFR